MLVYNGKVVTSPADKWVQPPIGPYTIRLKYRDGFTPTFTKGTGVLFSKSQNIWDLTYTNADWSDLLRAHYSLREVIAVGDTSGVTNMYRMFLDCDGLTSVPWFDTSNVTNMGGMFYSCLNLTAVPFFDTSNVTSMEGMLWRCYNLTSVPLFDTSNVTNMRSMLYGCEKITSIPLFDTSKVVVIDNMCYSCNLVETGALALYQQASGQEVPPIMYSGCFMYCGSNTTTGAAELALIPSSWGGLA